MAELFEITLRDEIACVEREIRMRQQVYPRRIADRNLLIRLTLTGARD